MTSAITPLERRIAASESMCENAMRSSFDKVPIVSAKSNSGCSARIRTARAAPIIPLASLMLVMSSSVIFRSAMSAYACLYCL